MTISNNIAVRPATDSDLELLVRFQIAMASESEDKGLDENTLRHGIATALSSDDLALYIVAEIAGEPVGTLMLTWEWSDWRNGRFWWIQSVYVSPEYRRQGVYKALYYYVAEGARQQGDVCGLRLYVDKDNSIAQGVYSGLQMRPTNYDMYEIDFNSSPVVQMEVKPEEVEENATG